MSDTCNKHIILYSIFLGILSMALMLSYNLNKEVVENVEAQGKTEIQIEPSSTGIDGVYEEIYQNTNLQQPLTISLPSADVAERMVFSEKYAKQCIQLSFEGLPKDYFKNNPLTGNAEGVKDIVCQYDNGKTVVSIYLTEILACTQKRKDKEISLSFEPMGDVYDKMVVLDPGHGGEETGLSAGGVREKDVTLNVVLKLKELLDETDVKVLCTRLDDETVDNQMRVDLANEVNADLFLSVHCALDESDKEHQGITTYYNETFFIPDFGNADFAYLVEEKAVRAVSGYALGLEAGEKYSDLLKSSMVPTAYIEIGYLSNETERELLQQEAYVDKLAQGLYDSIISSYEQMTE